MPAKKKEVKKEVNIDLLYKKVNDLGRLVDELQVNFSALTSIIINLEEKYKARDSLFHRIKERLGL